MSENQAADFIIETRQLIRVYRIGAHLEVPALRGVDLCISPGQVVAVKGRSGSGKTTLLNCLGGLDRPDGGEVLIAGQDLINPERRTINSFSPQYDRVCLPVLWPFTDPLGF
jgi:ABC-type lipoprotein export system ATPase subunit